MKTRLKQFKLEYYESEYFVNYITAYVTDGRISKIVNIFIMDDPFSPYSDTFTEIKEFSLVHFGFEKEVKKFLLAYYEHNNFEKYLEFISTLCGNEKCKYLNPRTLCPKE